MPSTNWIMRIFKSWGTVDLSRSWVNTYELVTPTALAPTDLITDLNTLVAAEKGLHLNLVQYVQATISTWENEPGTYDPLSFVTVPLSGVGALSPGTADALDSNVTFMVRYQAATGRTGRRFYRGCMTEAEVSANNQGYFQLVTASAFIDSGTVMNGFRTALAPLLGSGSGTAKLYLLGKGITFPTSPRQVTTVKAGGVVINRRNHRYFDKHVTTFG